MHGPQLRMPPSKKVSNLMARRARLEARRAPGHLVPSQGPCCTSQRALSKQLMGVGEPPPTWQGRPRAVAAKAPKRPVLKPESQAARQGASNADIGTRPSCFLPAAQKIARTQQRSYKERLLTCRASEKFLHIQNTHRDALVFGSTTPATLNTLRSPVAPHHPGSPRTPEQVLAGLHQN